MEVTMAAAEPEVEQSEAGQMRDTDEGSAAAATTPASYANFEHPPGWDQWSKETKRHATEKWSGGFRQGRLGCVKLTFGESYTSLLSPQPTATPPPTPAPGERGGELGRRSLFGDRRLLCCLL